MNWKLSHDGMSASRTLENGAIESRLLTAIPDDEIVGVLPADPFPPPGNATMRQARLALLQSGLLDQVNAVVASMPGAEGDAARIEWEFSTTVERSSPLVQALSGALNLTEAQLDDLFTLAATL